jgi:hypothetical protein
VLRSLSEDHKLDCIPAIRLDRGNPDGGTSENSFNAKFAHNLHKRANARYKEGTARGFLSPLRKASDRIFGWHPSKDAKLHQGEVRRIYLPRTPVNNVGCSQEK